MHAVLEQVLNPETMDELFQATRKTKVWLSIQLYFLNRAMLFDLKRAPQYVKLLLFT